MNISDAKKIISEAGRELIARSLAARTWGNISCRAEGGVVAVTPSGMAYDLITPDDVVTVDLSTGEISGRHKPTAEIFLHTEPYALCPDVNFILHTHQTYATAIGLAGFGKLPPDIGISSYAPPGSRELADSVIDAFRRGYRTVLMPRHGAVIAAPDMRSAFDLAERFEKLSSDLLSCDIPDALPDTELLSQALSLARTEFECCRANSSKYAIAAAALCAPIPTQLDDAAMLFGDKLPFAELHDLNMALHRYGAALVKGVGVICAASDHVDTEALSALAEKVCLCYLHTVACGDPSPLPPEDVKLLHDSYLSGYSKRLHGDLE
ncbi:MAG: class II aldolase/adducin family protein [Oscillospiraceae bacterium]|nr:class II aldolase/adducin family protein [Oscillospiraceae bacterium]